MIVVGRGVSAGHGTGWNRAATDSARAAMNVQAHASSQVYYRHSGVARYMAKERDVLAAPGVSTQVVDGRVGQEDDGQSRDVLFQGGNNLVRGEGGIPSNVDQNADSAIELE